MQIISREEAKSKGLKHYFSGHTCPAGHIAPRYVSAGTCTQCAHEKSKYAVRKPRDPVKRRAYERQWLGYPEPTRPEPPLCECCNKLPTVKSLGLDHCHDTGQFRGWLCHRCNLGIGMLGDTLESVRLAVAYLERALA